MATKDKKTVKKTAKKTAKKKAAKKDVKKKVAKKTVKKKTAKKASKKTTAKKAAKKTTAKKAAKKTTKKAAKRKRNRKCCSHCPDYEYCDERGYCCDYCDYYLNGKCTYGKKKGIPSLDEEIELPDYRGDDYGIDDYDAYEAVYE